MSRNRDLANIITSDEDISGNKTFTEDTYFEGNVGIGTNTPSEKLSIEGNVSANGSVTANSFVGTLAGNANTASSLATARTIALSGDVTGSASFDGSANVTISANVDSKVSRTSSTGSAVIPVGTELQRDASPSAGYFRFNSDTSKFEGYDGIEWGEIAGGGGGASFSSATVIDITTTESGNTFSLGEEVSDALVSLNGAWVSPNDFSLSGNNIVFDFSLEVDDEILVYPIIQNVDDVQLVDNLSSTDATKALSANQGSVIQAALDLKAPLASPALTGVPTAPTANAGTNTTQIATTAFVQTAVSGLVDTAPETLDTLNELAAALGDDPNFATTVANTISSKVSLSGDQTIAGVKTFSNNAIFDGNVGIGTSSPSAKIEVSGGNIKSGFAHVGGRSFTGNDTNYYKIGTWKGAQEGARIKLEIVGTRSFSQGAQSAGETVITAVWNNGNTIDGSFYGTTLGALTTTNVAHKKTDSDIEFWVKNGTYSSTATFAYCTGGYWENEDEDTGAATLPSGATELSSLLAITTNGAEHMRINSAGNVGIGTSSPSQKLDVNGSMIIQESTRIDTGAAGLVFDFPNVSGVDGRIVSRDTNFSDYKNLQIGANTTVFVNGGFERACITNAGNVGIGTSSPSEKLELFNGSSDCAIKFGSDTGSWTINNIRSTHALTITDSDGTGEVMRIDTNGSVGIGTSSPSERLHVAGNINSSGSKIGFGTTDAFTAYGAYSAAHYGVSWSGANPLSVSGYYGVGIFTSGTERVRVDGGGNVGINTSSPAEKLHVRTGSTYAAAFNTTQGVSSETRISIGGFSNGGGGEGGSVSIGALHNHSATTLSSMVFYNNGSTERMRITDAGNVGIGTTSPSHKLHTVGHTVSTGGYSSGSVLSYTVPAGTYNVGTWYTFTDRAAIQNLGFGDGMYIFRVYENTYAAGGGNYYVIYMSEPFWFWNVASNAGNRQEFRMSPIRMGHAANGPGNYIQIAMKENFGGGPHEFQWTPIGSNITLDGTDGKNVIIDMYKMAGGF